MTAFAPGERPRGPGSGNRCGHDPRRWRSQLQRPLPPKLPPFIRDEMIGRLVDAIESQRLLQMLPRLAAVLPRKSTERKRRNRSERLEAIGLVLLACAARMDLLTLRVGIPDDEGDGWSGASREDHLAPETGLTVGRIDRALADLYRAGYLLSDGQPCERKTDEAGRPLFRPDGSEHWIGRPARRRFSSWFFESCGTRVTLEGARRAASKRRRAQAAGDVFRAGEVPAPGSAFDPAFALAQQIRQQRPELSEWDALHEARRQLREPEREH